MTDDPFAPSDHASPPPDDAGKRRSFSDEERRAADESLSAALQSLEEMLDSGNGKSPSRPSEPVSTQLRQPAGSQYTIPLLNEVVAPATEATAPPPADSQPPSISDDTACQSVIDRLASELEVIVQSSVEEALARASKDIRQRLRTHIDIILPEILEEIAEIQSRKQP